MENCIWKALFSNCISGGVGFEYQFFVKDMGLEFSTNLLISGKSSSKIFLVEIEDTVSESVFSLETISFSFLEIVQAVLLEVPSVLTFKSENIFSTISRDLDWEV